MLKEFFSPSCLGCMHDVSNITAAERGPVPLFANRLGSIGRHGCIVAGGVGLLPTGWQAAWATAGRLHGCDLHGVSDVDERRSQ